MILEFIKNIYFYVIAILLYPLILLLMPFHMALSYLGNIRITSIDNDKQLKEYNLKEYKTLTKVVLYRVVLIAFCLLIIFDLIDDISLMLIRALFWVKHTHHEIESYLF